MSAKPLTSPRLLPLLGSLSLQTPGSIRPVAPGEGAESRSRQDLGRAWRGPLETRAPALLPAPRLPGPAARPLRGKVTLPISVWETKDQLSVSCGVGDKLRGARTSHARRPGAV